MSEKKKPITKAMVVKSIAESTGRSNKEVVEVLDALANIAKEQLGKKGPGVFVLPNLLKLTLVKKPATKARKGINPFTKEEVVFKAKPAKNVVKAKALKGFQEAIKV
jgi:nucleoid DNA-binding protein